MGLKRSWMPTQDQLVCRDIQHSWDPYTASRQGRQFIRVLRCGRCGSHKTQTISHNGFVLKSHMDYPAGYLRINEGRLTRMDRAALRVRNMTS